MSVATVSLDSRWSGFDGPFGGYAVGLLIDAAVARSSYRLASISANFVSGMTMAGVTIEVEQLHRGRSTELLRLVLRQGGRARVHATAELVDDPAAPPTPGHSVPWARTTTTAEPPAEGVNLGRVVLPFDDMIELRSPASPALAAEMVSWARFRSEVDDLSLATDEALLAVLLDAPTPGLFGEADPPAFVPSVDYTVHFAPCHEVDLGRWMSLTHTTAWATRSYCADETTVWSDDGRLLAQLRQTRAVRREPQARTVAGGTVGTER